MRGQRTRIFLSDEEQTQLISLSRKLNAPYKLVRRARIILMAAEGKSHQETAAKLDIRPEVVTTWVKRWNETSDGKDKKVESRLEDMRRPGAPNKFSPEQKCQIIAVACEKPEVYKRPITHWTNRELADEVMKQGIVDSISPRHTGHILKKTMCALIKYGTG